MASEIVAHIAQGTEIRQIQIRGAVTQPAGKDEPEDVHEILEMVDLDWASLGHSGRTTLAIMTPSEVERADWQVRNERVLGHHEVGSVWRPSSQ